MLETTGRSNGRLSSCCVVKDGVSSLARFTKDVESKSNNNYQFFCIPNIEAFLGVLKYHGQFVRLEREGEKITVISGNKQTTVQASENALASQTMRMTIQEATTVANNLAKKIEPLTGNYTQDSGKVNEPLISFYEVDSTDLFEAFRMDSMNNHKSGKFTIKINTRAINNKAILSVQTGSETKGLNEVEIMQQDISKQVYPAHKPYIQNITAVFEGGLDHIFKIWNTPVNLHFLNWASDNQGIKMVIDLGNDDFIFQSSLTSRGHDS